jgi:transposase
MRALTAFNIWRRFGMAASDPVPLPLDGQRRDVMKAPDDVSAMLRLKAVGWGSKRIAAELGCARNTVRRWLAEGDWRACASPSRSKKLDGLSDWLAERFRRHAGNADVVRQELASEKGIVVSLRTVERATAPLRRELVAAARATMRFETQPGEQLQIDFGERRVEIDGIAVKVFFFVATFGYSRRLHVRPYGHERQDSWFDGLESAFRAFGGVPREVLLDNGKALILHHDPASREVVLHPRLHAFARHCGFRIRACAPYRACTKGKDERGVAYVKRNAIAGRRFATWSEMEAHLEAWTREIADARMHGTTGETPRQRAAIVCCREIDVDNEGRHLAGQASETRRAANGTSPSAPSGALDCHLWHFAHPLHCLALGPDQRHSNCAANEHDDATDDEPRVEAVERGRRVLDEAAHDVGRQ